MTNNPPRSAIIVVGARDGEALAPSIAAATGTLGLSVHSAPDAAAALRAFDEVTRTGGDVSAFVLAPALSAPLVAARRLHGAVPAVHLVFVLDVVGGAPVRRELALAPRIGTGWTSATDDGDAVLAALRDAVRATRQRQRMRTTLTRVRDQLPAREPGPLRIADLDPTAAIADDERRRARYEVTQALVDEPDLAAAAPRILGGLGAGLGWCAAVLWMVDVAANRLRCAEVWRADGAALDEFVAATRAMTFAPGEGRPGQAWLERRGRIVPDLATDDRDRGAGSADIAAREDLHTAYFQPIVLGRQVLGVIELVGRERRVLDADFEEMMASAASSIAQLADRNRIERALRVQNEELVAADRRKNEFLAILAHELRNPLAPIGNAVRVLQDATASAADHEHGLAVIERQAATLARLVDDLLDVSRISTGKLEIKRERVPVADVIGRAVDTVRPVIERSGLVLTVTVPSESLWLDADPLRIEQVLTNLLVNAGKYTDRGGRVWLTAAPSGRPGGARRVVIAVRDTGIGISDALRAQVFDLYAQAPASRSRDRGGLGIGLTLVKRLVELHGGEVGVASAGPGKGSEFTVRLPLVDPPALRVAPAGDAVHAEARGLRVLIVDDNNDAADTLEMVLRRDGHTVHTAYDGPTALAAAAAFRPHVILLDIGLPGMNGYEVASKVRADAAGPPPLMVAVTGWGMDADRDRSRQLGIAHHLVKPARLSEIRAILAEVAPADRA